MHRDSKERRRRAMETQREEDTPEQACEQRRA